MKRPLLGIAAVIAAVAFAAPVWAAGTATDFSSARTAYSQKKADCKERAKAKNFGVHFIKRNRWIKDCIAGAH